ncbi:MAG: DUF563 domain-containing protein [Leptolyngbyaceae cyanobacterium]
MTKTKNVIFLQPTPPVRCGGTVDRYYHFIFDLVLPLYCLRRQVAPEVTFLMEAPGGFIERLLKIFPQGVEAVDADNIISNLDTVPLIGMNPKGVGLSERLLNMFREDICRCLNVDAGGDTNKILLIERLPPDEYFFTQAKVQGGGASWRSLQNHAEVRSTLESMVKAPFEFHNLQLEKMSFEDQIYHFNRACIVIAQHGAGLTNCLWMRRNTHVVELNHGDDNNDHYRVICRLRQLGYARYETDSNHATIDVERFSDWLLKKISLAQYFTTPKVASLKC